MLKAIWYLPTETYVAAHETAPIGMEIAKPIQVIGKNVISCDIEYMAKKKELGKSKLNLTGSRTTHCQPFSLTIVEFC